MRPILTTAMLEQHRSALSEMDVIWAPLYDFNTYTATTGHTQLSFFAIPQGQGTTSAPGASGTKTNADTNMDSAGQLGKGNMQYVTGIEMLFYPGVDPGRAAVAAADVGEFVDDVYDVGKSGVVTFKVGSGRVYVEDGPLMLFPPSARLAVASAITTAEANTATSAFAEVNYATWSGEVYTIVPVLLDANQTFTFTVTWPAAVTLDSTANARLGARMRGYRIRNAQ